METTPARRTIRLKERVSRECRLRPAEVAFLLDHHRAHVEVAPTGRRGRYRVTPAGHVGTIVGPMCRWVIRPKVPLANLFHLLDPAGPCPVSEDQVSPLVGTELLDFLAARLASLLEERTAAGLHRAYAVRRVQGPFLHGRLDLPAHLRDPHGRKDQFHCTYEDFSPDVPCNQVARAVAELVLASPLLGDRVRPALHRCLLAFGGVSPVPVSAELFREAGPTRLTEAYRPLIDLCRLLADGLAPGHAGGQTPCPAFLLDMERLFERYLTTGITRALAAKERFEVAVQPLCLAGRPVAGQPDLTIRPDLVIRRDGRPIAVVDAKWKGLQDTPLVTEDVYQMLAYCTALGVRRAVLVYPGRRDRVWTYDLAQGPVRLEVRTLRVVGSPSRCQASLHRLGNALGGPGDS
jgi:5-methylcytosine-specific restriction enzyme subunit McrC